MYILRTPCRLTLNPLSTPHTAPPPPPHKHTHYVPSAVQSPSLSMTRAQRRVARRSTSSPTCPSMEKCTSWMACAPRPSAWGPTALGRTGRASPAQRSSAGWRGASFSDQHRRRHARMHAQTPARLQTECADTLVRGRSDVSLKPLTTELPAELFPLPCVLDRYTAEIRFNLLAVCKDVRAQLQAEIAGLESLVAAVSLVTVFKLCASRAHSRAYPPPCTCLVALPRTSIYLTAHLCALSHRHTHQSP